MRHSPSGLEGTEGVETGYSPPLALVLHFLACPIGGTVVEAVVYVWRRPTGRQAQVSCNKGTGRY